MTKARKGCVDLRNAVSRATVERIPMYLEYLRKSKSPSVSATVIARELSYGEVQVRKDLSFISGAGRPRVGYQTDELIRDIEHFIGKDAPNEAVIVGAGKLGLALLEYNGFQELGVKITAAFDCKPRRSHTGVYPIEELYGYCKEHQIKIGIITVPAEGAQEVCDRLVAAGVTAIWNFAPVTLEHPCTVAVVNEKLAISLSMLRQTVTPTI